MRRVELIKDSSRLRGIRVRVSVSVYLRLVTLLHRVRVRVEDGI